jgi:hypothetical protein
MAKKNGSNGKKKTPAPKTKKKETYKKDGTYYSKVKRVTYGPAPPKRKKRTVTKTTSSSDAYDVKNKRTQKNKTVARKSGGSTSTEKVKRIERDKSGKPVSRGKFKSKTTISPSGRKVYKSLQVTKPIKKKKNKPAAKPATKRKVSSTRMKSGVRGKTKLLRGTRKKK